MCLFRKKKTDQDIILNSKETVGKNAQDLVVLCGKLQDFPELEQQCHIIHDELKYFSPSKDAEVLKIDQVIHERIDDIKIEINKLTKDRNSDRVNSLFTNLKSYIIQRNEESKRYKRK